MQINQNPIGQSINKIQTIKAYVDPQRDPNLTSSSQVSPLVVKEILDELVTVLAEEPKLSRIFAKWTGNKGLALDQLNTNALAIRILSTEKPLNISESEQTLQRRQEVLVKGKKLIGSHLQDAPPALLQANWQKSYSNLIQVNNLIQKLEELESDQVTNIREIQDKLKVWAFHFFSSWSKNSASKSHIETTSSLYRVQVK